ncbi:MAG: homoserine dehydrogenase [Nitratireductor sp.]
MAEALRIGIAGVGTVGASLVRIMQNKHNELSQKCGRPIEIVAVCARDKTKDRGCDLSNVEWFDSPDALAQSDLIDVYVELIGGEEGAAYSSVVSALDAGKHVVTANKALLAKHGVELAIKAEAKGTILNFEAAVAGGIPIIKTMREALSSNSIERIYGILNGTCNYMLTRMENEGISFDDCLKDAQRLGYAEADPSFDIGGNDTAHKLAILTSIAFGTQISADDIYLEGITSITTEDIVAAKELGYRIKLLGVAQRTASGIEQRVHPTMVPIGSAIAEISGVTNAIAIEADIVGQLVLSGPGAGGDATASAVSGDICDIAKAQIGHQHAPALGKPAALLEPYTRAKMRAHEGCYFIRLSVTDQAGAFASIASRMAEENISLQSIVQRKAEGAVNDDNSDTTSQPIILITHATNEKAIKSALDKIDSDGHLSNKAQMIRIEN